ncbi:MULTISPECIES: LysR family transcriptional regulator [Enterococcus]|uniref:LysR family transcriptional regulator n=1 Tax=Enterococcus TaxID=1350 RepID=UPI001BD0F421|nr:MULTISPECIES: LysR family transcriptional regulator [Enterococcus]
MKIQYLREFLVLAKTLNFTNASEELFISPSTLSKHLNIIENELGVKLFIRTTRTVILSQYGEIFFEYAKKMTSLESEIKNNIVLLNTQTLKIGTTCRLNESVIKYKKSNPCVVVKVYDYLSIKRITSMLQNNIIDLFFTFEDVSLPFPSQLLFQDELVAVIPNSNINSTSNSINLKDLRNECFILFNEEYYDTQFCIKNCKENGFIPNIVMYADRGDKIVDLVSMEFGISLLMKRSSTFINNKHVSFVKILPSIKRNLIVYYPSTEELSETAIDFLEEIKKDLTENIFLNNYSEQSFYHFKNDDLPN